MATNQHRTSAPRIAWLCGALWCPLLVVSCQSQPHAHHRPLEMADAAPVEHGAVGPIGWLASPSDDLAIVLQSDPDSEAAASIVILNTKRSAEVTRRTVAGVVDAVAASPDRMRLVLEVVPGPWPHKGPGGLPLADGGLAPTDLAVFEGSTSPPRLLGLPGLRNSTPRCSPAHGREVVFVHVPPVSGGISNWFSMPHGVWRIDTATGERRQLTHPRAPAVDMWPRWSPDGKRVVFRRLAMSPLAADLWLVGADGRGERKLTDCGQVQQRPFGWSADGKHVLFVRQAIADQASAGRPGPTLWSVDVATGRMQQLLSWEQLGRPAEASDLVLAPGGAWVAVRHQTGGSADSGISVIHIASGTERRMPARGHIGAMAWSRDARQLAYVCDESQVWVADVARKGAPVRRVWGD